MEIVFTDSKRIGRLDYVAAWYMKSAQYLNRLNIDLSSKTKIAFVSTNSITQGEQVNILWKELSDTYKIKIHFAHRTFRWDNEAKGNAAVHVVIIGFANFDTENKLLYEYSHNGSEPHSHSVKNINAYLTEGKNIFIESRAKPIHDFPSMTKGSQPTDGGHLILTADEYEELLENEPVADKWIKPFIGGYEFINNQTRYCLWLKDISPAELKQMPYVLERISKVKETRLSSPTPSVKEFSKYPHLFTQDRQPHTSYLVIPEVSSINRKYIPIGFVDPGTICSNKLQIINDATLYMFGTLQSLMHMTWTRYVSGRMKSDYSYSPQVYHNFPFPYNINEKNKLAVEQAAQKVMDARAQFPDSSLADLYDPNTMPPILVKAHQQLDKTVDACYGVKTFASEAKRMEFLFELHERYVKRDNKKPHETQG